MAGRIILNLNFLKTQDLTSFKKAYHQFIFKTTTPTTDLQVITLS